MTTSSKTKRLENIEINLTPKEWAIRLIDDTRKPELMADQHGFWKRWEGLDPFGWLGKQAEKTHPGSKPEDISARRKLSRDLATEFHALKKLVGEINEIIQKRTERAGLEAALKISALQTVILQDAFGRTARKATGWIKRVEPEDKDEKENIDVMLAELDAYAGIDFGEKYSDSIRIGDLKLRFPTVIENWIKEAVRLIRDVYAHEAAVKLIQDQHFDGHQVMLLDVEAGLKRAIQAIEDAAISFNEYLRVRMELFKAEWEEEEEEDNDIVSAIPGEREGALKIHLDKLKAEAIPFAKSLAKEWAKAAKDRAAFDIRQHYGEEKAAFHEYFIRRGWIKE